MFISQAKKGAGFYNALILVAVVAVGCIVALSFTKIVKDPKNPDGFRHSLGLKKK